MERERLPRPCGRCGWQAVQHSPLDSHPSRLDTLLRMRIGISTSVVQRGKTGIAQYLFALLRAFVGEGGQDSFCLFVLEEDLPLFDFVEGRMNLVPVSERF